MTPLFRDAPRSLRCESELQRALIRMRKPWALSCVLVRAAVKEAQQRPARHEGMPDEIPRPLTALQARPGE